MTSSLKSLTKTLFLAFLSVSLFFGTFEQAQCKEVEVTATGYGDNEELALLNALENAVRQTSPVSIQKTTPTSRLNIEESYDSKDDIRGNFKAKQSLLGKDTDASATASATSTGKDKTSVSYQNIDVRYKGKIKSYEVLKNETKGSRYQTTIKAKVFVPDDYEPKLSLQKNRKDNPSLYVVPFVLGGTNKINCSNEKFSMDNIISGITGGLVNHISKSGRFNLVERYNSEGYDKEMFLIAENLAKEENQAKLRQMVSADYLVLGDITNFSVTRTKSEIPITGEILYRTTAKINVTYRLVDTATMEIVYTSSVNERLSRQSENVSCQTMINNLLKIVPKQISNDILRGVFADYQPKNWDKKSVKKMMDRQMEAEENCELNDEGCDDLPLTSSQKSTKGNKEVKNNPVPQRPIIKLPLDD